MFAIRRIDSPADLATARMLFREYADSLGVDLCFQDFESELATLPGAYRPPRGALLLAERGEDAAGCVALRPLEPPTMAGAQALYRRLGFREVAPYRLNPIPGALYMECDLARSAR
jgi:hypothetical protein